MKCMLSVCADSAALDKAANSVSLFSIIDVVSSLSFPYTLPQLAMLFILKKEAGDHKNATGQVTLTFQPKADGAAAQEKGTVPIKFDFEGKPNLRILIRADGVSLESPGTLYSRIYQKELLLGEWAIEVNQKKERPAIDRPVAAAPPQ